MKTWEEWLQAQRTICESHGVPWALTERQEIVGIAENAFTNEKPLNGLRVKNAEGTSGWYLWAGTDLPDDPDFFQPHCAEHLIELQPDLLKFLGPPAGYRFLFDDKGYVDIWFDNNLLEDEGKTRNPT